MNNATNNEAKKTTTATKKAYQIVAPNGLKILGNNLRTNKAARRVIKKIKSRYGIKAYFAAISVNKAILQITEHDCGIKDGMGSSEIKEVVRAARTWWQGQGE